MALGKGLGSLIPPKTKTPLSTEASKTKERVLEIPLNDILPSPNQPRKNFSHDELEDLKGSILRHGILQPLVVSPVTRANPDTKAPKDSDVTSEPNEAGAVGTGQGPGSRAKLTTGHDTDLTPTNAGNAREREQYILIAGERRLRAARMAGMQKVPVVIRTCQDNERLELSLIENLQRQNLNPIEEARGYQALIQQFGLTQEEIGQRMGKSRPVVANSLRLLRLPEEIQRAVIGNKISASGARILAGLDNQNRQLALFKKMLQGKMTVRESEQSARLSSLRRKRSLLDPNLQELQDELQSALRTKVIIKKSNKRENGQIIIEFYSREELNEIVRKITARR